MKKKFLSSNLLNRTVSKAVMMLLLITQSAFTVEAATNESIKLATPVLKVTGGKISGCFGEDSHVLIYKGIPYAAAPIGDLRWKRPQPVKAWQGTRLCNTFSAMAFQRERDMKSFYGKEFHDPQSEPQRSEDCLYLNVWTPRSAAGNTKAKLPVVMWIHGGAYMSGFGFEKEMDGEAWAKRGVILVTINYRLNVFGFLAHPALSAENKEGLSGNYGLYDQIAALQWVVNNIAQFGGDPKNITVAGQSAGAGSVKNLVTSPLCKGLISKAIIQSGGGMGEFISTEANKDKLETLGMQMMDQLQAHTAKEMRALSAEKVLGALMPFMRQAKAGLFTAPYIDGVALTEDFTYAVKDNSIADIPYLIGSNANDIMPMDKAITDFAAARDSLSKRPVYVYHFDRSLPGDTAGSFHSAEMWYTFHTLKRSWRPFTQADYELSDRMVTYWTNFIKYGSPDGDKTWKPCTRKAPYVEVLQTKK